MRALRWIGLILALLALIAVAVVGGFLLGKQSVPVPTPTETPTPTPTAHADGVYSWEHLAPGDCVSDFSTAWQDTYTVVGCDTDHNGQMLVRAEFPDAPAAYPGAKVLAAQVTKLCSDKANYDAKAAAEYPSIYFPGAYPMTEQEWMASPTYVCFATAGKAFVLTTSLMPGAQPAPTPTVTPTATPTA